MKMMAATPEAKKKYDALVKKWSNRMDGFIKDTGRIRQRHREVGGIYKAR